MVDRPLTPARSSGTHLSRCPARPPAACLSMLVGPPFLYTPVYRFCGSGEDEEEGDGEWDAYVEMRTWKGPGLPRDGSGSMSGLHV